MSRRTILIAKKWIKIFLFKIKFAVYFNLLKVTEVVSMSRVSFNPVSICSDLTKNRFKYHNVLIWKFAQVQEHTYRISEGIMFDTGVARGNVGDNYSSCESRTWRTSRNNNVIINFFMQMTFKSRDIYMQFTSSCNDARLYGKLRKLKRAFVGTIRFYVSIFRFRLYIIYY